MLYIIYVTRFLVVLSIKSRFNYFQVYFYHTSPQNPFKRGINHEVEVGAGLNGHLELIVFLDGQALTKPY